MKRKINIRRVLILILIPVLLISLLVINFNRIRFMIKGYDAEEIKIILNLDRDSMESILDSDDKLIIKKYNKIKNNQNYVLYNLYASKTNASCKDTVSYVDGYVKIKSKLDKLGYKTSIVFKNLDLYTLQNLNLLVQQNITYKTSKKYLAIQGAQVVDLEAYLKSGLQPLQAVLSISYPMIDSSQSSDRTYTIENPNNLVLIKKGFLVSSDYVPSTLRTVNMPYETIEGQMSDEAASALEKMYSEAASDGYNLVIKSSYRSYEDQVAIYNEYFAIYDAAYAASLVSVPGSSEHQLGLSVDLTSQDVIDGVYGTFGETPAYQWVSKNAYKYGFILRYPENQSSRTGATNEPWHFRYVGKKAAKEIYEKNWVLEDYIEAYGFSYEMHMN